MMSGLDLGDAKRTTKIEWTEATWNPTVGCSLASAGCTNCYAMRSAHRIAGRGLSPAYRGLTTTSKAGPVWTGKVRQATENAVKKPLRIRTPSVIFVNSMSDLFHPDMEEQWIIDAFEVMRVASHHTYQVLTKRPEVAAEFYRKHPEYHGMPQVWLGVSVEREDAEWRIDSLRAIPVAVRFLSVEPLIGPCGVLDLTRIHWVITGGESGPSARPCKPEWIRHVRDRCKQQDVPFFHKQWGEWRNNPLYQKGGTGTHADALAYAKKHDPDPQAKGGAGVDGVLHREMPTVLNRRLA